VSQSAVQDIYPDDLAHCYGCGRLNEHGLHVRSMWNGDETVATITPRPYHTAVPGYVYGGRIAEVKEKKVIVEVDVYAEDAHCARGRVVAVRMPEHMAGGA